MLVPRDYQDEAVNCLFDYFAKTPDLDRHPVVAMPTGTGKSVVIAAFLERALRMYARQKILVATHVKELIEQNYLEFMGIWPTAPAGIYSAGLKRKDLHSNITFCGIASINKAIADFGRVDLMIIDECHLLSQNDESMYQKVIAKLKEVNPYLRVIGLTATPWRAGQGKITDDGIFTDIPFDVTSMAAFNRFIKEGYLVPLVPKSTETILDVTGVHLQGGEFNQKELQLAVDKDEITFAALKEAVLHGYGREHWLVFGSGIQHVLKITQMLNYLGISARCVHSKMTDKERDDNIADWKAGKFKAMVNNGILTTGVNFKAIDLIVMLRPTQSTVLWVQMLGRGTRPLYADGFDLTTTQGRLDAIEHSEKQNCLVMDFAQNSKRLGPINDPVLPRKKGGAKGDVPIKICDGCGMYNHISARYCGGEPFKSPAGCGMEFTFKVLLKMNASSEELIKNDMPVVEVLKVDTITFKIHNKPGKPPSLWVTYFCGVHRYNQWVLFEHEGFGRRKAREWWEERTSLPFPESTDAAAKLFDQLLAPTHIKVWLNKPHPEILQVSFTGGFQTAINGNEIPF